MSDNLSLLRSFSVPTLTEEEAFCFSKPIDKNIDLFFPELPWFAAEVIYTFGSHSYLKILKYYAGKRIPLKMIFQIPELSSIPMRFVNIIEANVGEYVEIQTISSFQQNIRHGLIRSKLDKLSVSYLSSYYDTPLRTVYRIKKKYYDF